MHTAATDQRFSKDSIFLHHLPILKKLGPVNMYPLLAFGFFLSVVSCVPIGNDPNWYPSNYILKNIQLIRTRPDVNSLYTVTLDCR